VTYAHAGALLAIALYCALVLSACTRSWAQEARCVYYEWEQVIGASETFRQSNGEVDLAGFLRSSAENRTDGFAAMDVPSPYDEEQDLAVSIEQLSTMTAEVTRGILRTRVADYAASLRNAGIPQVDPGLCDLTSPTG
jgi:hypothetical protein